MKLFLTLCVLLSAGFFIENKMILSLRRKKFGGKLRIMHISDIHKSRKGKNNCRISEMAEREKPDLIFVTGDIVSRSETDFEPTEILLKRLCKTAPVYMVSGNHEQSLNGSMINEFSEMLRRTDVRRLENSSVNITVNDRNLYIYGIVQKYTTYKKNGGYRNLDIFTLNDMENALGKRPDGEVILLAHNPLWADVYAEWGADYTFSGHVHGGVVRIFGRGLLSPERKFFPEYSKGIYNTGNMKLCVSGGIGKIRLFNPPEIVFYEL